MSRLRSIGAAGYKLVRQTIEEYLEDDAGLIAAGLAFYTILSVAPLLVLAVWTMAPLLGQHSVRVGIVDQVRQFAGGSTAGVVDAVLANAAKTRVGYLQAAFSGAIALYGATRVFVYVQRALNKVWGVRVPTGGAFKRGLLKVVRKRLLSAGMILVAVLIILVSLLFGTALELLSGKWPDVFGAQAVYRALDLGVTFALVSLLFIVVFRFLPDAEIAFRDVWVGAVVTAALFVAGKFPVAFYLAHVPKGSAFGAAGSLVVLSLWAYYCCSIFLLGAEFTEVLAKHHGRGIRPEEHAVRVHREEGRGPASGQS